MSRLCFQFALTAALISPACSKSADGGKPNMDSFKSNGVKIAYFTEGKGEPVILIHGWLSSAVINWALPGTSGELAKNFQVIALDVRGHGLSDKPLKEEDYGPELVEDVVRLMDHLKVRKAHIVGYSMGGIISGNFMVKHPDRVLSGTLGGMGWMPTGGFAQKAFDLIGKKDPKANSMAVCGRSLAKLALTEEEIKSIKVPVAILIGDDDKFIRKLYVDPLLKVHKDWPVVDIKDANHISCIVKPQFKEEIATWLKKQQKEK